MDNSKKEVSNKLFLAYVRMNLLNRARDAIAREFTVPKVNRKSRRDFMKKTFGVAAGTALVSAGLDPNVVMAESPNSVKTDYFSDKGRSDPEFQWPIEIHGDEPFFENDVILTIDDCTSIEQTRLMFETLRGAGAKATFFPSTGLINTSDPEARRLWVDIAQAGFEIGYHTHAHEEAYTQEELQNDFQLFMSSIRELTGDPAYQVHFVRPPYGNLNDDWKEWAAANEFTIVMWSFVPNDQLGISYFEAIADRDGGGRIVLLHPRVWDNNWLYDHISELVSFAEQAGGRVTSLSGK